MCTGNAAVHGDSVTTLLNTALEIFLSCAGQYLAGNLIIPFITA